MARPRITTLEICDFRAFPGPAPVTIELGGKNLFLYGENGVGKSTTPNEVLAAIEVVDKLLYSLKVLPTAEMNRRRIAED